MAFFPGGRPRGQKLACAVTASPNCLPVVQLRNKVFSSLVPCGSNSLTLSSLLTRPNQKPQTWFHELTHGTGRHRDDRPYVVTRPSPTRTV